MGSSRNKNSNSSQKEEGAFIHEASLRGFLRLNVMATDLKKLRSKSGLTQARAAAAAGVSQQTLSAYENGSRTIDEQALNRLLAVYAGPDNPVQREAPRPASNVISQHGFITFEDTDGRPHTLNVHRIIDIFPPGRANVAWKILTQSHETKISASTADDLRAALLR